MLKNKRFSKTIFLVPGVLYLIVAVFWMIRGDIWTPLDYQILDKFHQRAIEEKKRSIVSKKIAIIVETDQTKNHFSQTRLDRKIYAAVNYSLIKFNPKATIYDFIFRFEKGTASNLEFKRSLKALKAVYLPLGLNMKDQLARTPQEEKWNSRQLLPFMGIPVQKGKTARVYAYPSLLSHQDFIKDSFIAGHINIQSDSDGVFRHYPLLFKFELGYLPALSFSVFLDSIKVPLEEIIVDWGNQIIIPARPKNSLERDLVIPIDDKGKTYIPFASFWQDKSNNFKIMSLEHFLSHSEDPEYKNRLKIFFEDTFVFISDISEVGKQTGQTAIENKVPLVSLHVAFLNSLLTKNFYRKWSLNETFILLFFIVFIFSCSTSFKSSIYLYVLGVLTIIGLIWLTKFQFFSFRLFPLASLMASVLFIFLVILFYAIRENRVSSLLE